MKNISSEVCWTYGSFLSKFTQLPRNLENFFEARQALLSYSEIHFTSQDFYKILEISLKLREGQLLWVSLNFTKLFWSSLNFSKVRWSFLSIPENRWINQNLAQPFKSLLYCPEVRWTSHKFSEVLSIFPNLIVVRRTYFKVAVFPWSYQNFPKVNRTPLKFSELR